MAERRRRDYGTGSIYQRSDGRWIGAYQAGFTAAGTRRRKTVSASTEAAVKVKLRKALADLEKHGASDVSSRATVKSWADEWLPMIERTLRPNSYTASRSAVRTWIVPEIGHVRFSELTPAHVRKVADAQRKKGRSSSTQARTHSVLMQLLKAALTEGHPVAPRLLALDPPTVAVNDRTNLEVGQAVAMLEVASKLDDGSRWVAAFLEGMRQAETLGLTWDAVDFERNLIRLDWQLQPLNYREKRNPASGFRVPDGYEARQLQGRMHLVRPKSKKGRRVIPMVPWMASALQAWRELQVTNGQVSEHGLVWPRGGAINPGGPRDQKKDDQAWYALQDAVGARHPSGRHYTIHEARHTTATLLLEGGIEPVVVAAILGQSKMLEDYIHLSAERSGTLLVALEKVAERLALPPAPGGSAAAPTTGLPPE